MPWEESVPSFDLVSKIDTSELKNAVAMAQKEVIGRFDFKGSETEIELTETTIELRSSDDVKIKTALSILREKMAKRGIGMKCVEPKDIETSGTKRVKQTLILKNGIDKETAKAINKAIKESGLKVTSQYMDEKIRVQGKQIDDLQAAFQAARVSEDVKVDLQIENMKR
jgi:hypothetical protein